MMIEESYVRNLELIAMRKEDAKHQKGKKKVEKKAMRWKRVEEATTKEEEKMKRKEDSKAKKILTRLGQ